METKTFEKKLIYSDEAEYSRQLCDFRNNLEILNQIAERYEAIFSGKISMERLNQIFEGNYQALKEAAQVAITKTSRNDLLAEVSIKLFEEKLFDFEFNVSRLIDRFRKTSERQLFATFTPPGWFSLNSEGRFYIPDTTLALIREKCSNYISCPEEQGIRDQLQKLADLINEVYESLGENLRAQLDTNFLPLHYNICEFLSSDEDGKTIPDPQVNYKTLIS